MRSSRSRRISESSRKEFIPGDSGFNRVYPAPQYLPRKLAIVIVSFILMGLIIGLLTNISNLGN